MEVTSEPSQLPPAATGGAFRLNISPIALATMHGFGNLMPGHLSGASQQQPGAGGEASYAEYTEEESDSSSGVEEQSADRNRRVYRPSPETGRAQVNSVPVIRASGEWAYCFFS